MWPFRKTRRIEKPTSMGMRIPFSDQETEVIPRLTRDMPDTKLIPLDEDEPNCPRPSPEWLAETMKLAPVVSSDVRGLAALAAAHARLETADWNAERAAVLEQASTVVDAVSLEADDQNLADWEAELETSAELAERVRLETALMPLPPGLVQDIYGVTYPRTIATGDSVRIYLKSGGILSALTQLNLHGVARVWEGHIAWREVTDKYTRKPE